MTDGLYRCVYATRIKKSTLLQLHLLIDHIIFFRQYLFFPPQSLQEDDGVGDNQEEGDAGNESDMDLDLLAESESDSEASNHSNQVK